MVRNGDGRSRSGDIGRMLRRSRLACERWPRVEIAVTAVVAAIIITVIGAIVTTVIIVVVTIAVVRPVTIAIIIHAIISLIVSIVVSELRPVIDAVEVTWPVVGTLAPTIIGTINRTLARAITGALF